MGLPNLKVDPDFARFETFGRRRLAENQAKLPHCRCAGMRLASLDWVGRMRPSPHDLVRALCVDIKSLRTLDLTVFIALIILYSSTQWIKRYDN
jgi:hypothetical protein